MDGILNLSRRDFLKAGAGLTLGVALPDALAQMAGPGKGGTGTAAAGAFEPNAFVRIGTDNTVTVIVKHFEMGQGTFTGLPTLVAEELDADWSQIRAEGAPADPTRYNNLFMGPMQGTGGSTAMANSYEQMRKAGAAARAMLVAVAAERWKVAPAEITISRGVVQHAATNKTARFGSLAAAAAKQPVPQEVKLKAAQDFVFIGRRAPRTDARAKSNGSAIYTQDVQLPGMLTALVAHPPRFGGKVKSFDASKAKAVGGVVDVVAIPQGVAVLANDFWSAKKGRDALAVEWDESAAFKLGSDEIMAEYRRLVATPGLPAKKEGDAAVALASASKTFDAVYEFPYLAHAAMEPMNCVVKLSADACELWYAVQFQSIDQPAIAQALGMKPEQVKLNMLFAGGSFGRRANPQSDYVLEAVQIAKAIAGRAPIKLVWTREDDMRAGYYRPAYVHALKGGLDAQGNIVAWQHRVRGDDGEGRHRRDLGRGRVQSPLRDPQPRRRAALAEDGRAGTVVALGGLDPHGVLDRDLHRRARGRRRQGSVPAAPRAARQCSAAQAGARDGGDRVRLDPAARLRAGRRPARTRHRGARVVQHRGRAGRGGHGEARRVLAPRSRHVRGRLRRRGEPGRGPRADGERHRLRPHCRDVRRDHAQGRRGQAVELPRLHAAAPARDAPHRRVYRALGGEAHRGGRAGDSGHRAGGRKRARGRHGEAHPCSADQDLGPDVTGARRAHNWKHFITAPWAETC